MNLNEYKTDETKKKEGIWVEFDDARFLIRSTDTSKYRRAVQAAAKKRNPAAVRKDIETQTALGIEAVAEGILIDWEGVEDDGTPVECNRENKIAVLTQVPALRDHLATEAGDMANFSAEGVSADADDFREGD
jgi:hypothetical protein